jgi:hypothetical protein
MNPRSEASDRAFFLSIMLHCTSTAVLTFGAGHSKNKILSRIFLFKKCLEIPKLERCPGGGVNVNKLVLHFT